VKASGDCEEAGPVLRADERLDGLGELDMGLDESMDWL
jgi:hypothetical protein